MLGTNDSAEHKTDPKEIVQAIAEYLKTNNKDTEK